MGLKGLQVSCVVGIYAHERGRNQPLRLDLEIDYDFAAAAGSDQIGDAIDYDHVAAGISELAEHRKFRLVETMAEELAAMLFARFSPARTVRLEIRKSEAVPTAECAFVRLERKRA